MMEEDFPELDPAIIDIVNKQYQYRHKYWSAYFWPVRSKMNSLKLENDVKSLYFDCFNKINACYYHLKRIREEEGKIIYDDSYKDLKVSIFPGVIGLPSETIIHEYESFILQQEACLQIMAKIISRCFGSNNDKFKKLEKVLNNNSPTDKKKLSKSILELLEAFEPYFNEIKARESGAISPRDYATHHGQLKVGTINVYIPISEKEALPAYRSKKIDHLKRIDSEPPFQKEDLYDYCRRCFYNLSDFTGHVTGALLNFKPEFGEKGDKNGEKD